MLQLNNKTRFKGSLALFANPEGVDCAYGVVKATFLIEDDGTLSISKDQLPLAVADVFWDEPAKSSLKQAGEIGLAKSSTDILLSGHAYAPNGEALSSEVRLTVGALTKTVRVFGDRTWESGLFGMKISPPKPFRKIPLRYEYAFGGTYLQPEDESKTEVEPRNLVGRGLLPKRNKASWKGVPLPNLENPHQLIASPKDRPTPACFAPICPHWEPRKSYAGTYDETWTKKRAPYLPKDFDSRFLQVAAPSLVTPSYLQGGEPVEIVGATPGAPLRFKLPAHVVEMAFHFDGQVCASPLNLDTVCFEPDEKRFSMIWRACLVVDKKVHRLSELELRCPQSSSAREASGI
jgi:hypothetical protein